jgi:hypothetical protein
LASFSRPPQKDSVFPQKLFRIPSRKHVT